MIVSALYPRFRDVQIIWTVASTALFYGTPGAVSDLGGVAVGCGMSMALNPLSPIFELAQRWIIHPTDPAIPWPWEPAAGGPVRFAVAVTIYVVICVLAVLVFTREAPRIAEAL